MLLSEGQMSDYKGTRLIVDALPPAKHLLADRGYDADGFRDVLHSKDDRCAHTFFSAICIAAPVIFYLNQ